MLLVQGLSYHPPATLQPVLNNISLELAHQEMGLVVGSSGSGKTTLLEVLAGFVEWHSGSVMWRSQNLGAEELEQLSGLVFQFPERHFCGSTILEELRLGQLDMDGDRLSHALDSVGLGSLSLDASPQSLSGGQQRRLALAVQLIRQPYLLLLDEPTAGLDWSMRKQLINLLAKLKENWTILVVTHEPDELKHICDRRWQMSAGCLTPMV
jgi:energy-coupling factor transport system ATP-binding protein